MKKKKAALTLSIKRFISRVRKTLKPEKIILFGSRAREDWIYESDWDFVIV